MSCTLKERWLRLERLDATSEDAQALVAHAGACSECAKVLEMHRALIPRLALPPLAMTAEERARLWSRIDRGRAEASSPWFAWTIAGAAAALGAIALWVMLIPRPGNPPPRLVRGEAAILKTEEAINVGTLPEERWIRVSKGRVDLSFASIEIERSAVIWLPASGLREIPLIRIAEGSVELVIGRVDDRSVSVATPAARIDVVGAKLHLETTETRTIVRVDEGSVRIGGRILAAGESETIEAEAVRVPEPAAASEEVNARDRTDDREEALGVNAAHDRAPGRARKRGDARAAAPASNVNARAAAPSATGPTGDDARADREKIEEARSLLGKDDRSANRLAESVLERHPPKATEILALAVAADASRRRGLFTEADAYYARMVAHPEGAGFREEALYRRAAIAAELGRPSDALAFLDAADREAKNGALAPERAALKANALLKTGDLDAAARVLEESTVAERVVDRARLDVAKALLSTDPARAGRLAERVIGHKDLLEAEAASIVERARNGSR